jgi:hypothetical protein
MIRVARFIYTGTAWLFVAGVMVQVFLAGMVVVARQISWNNHISLGHILSAPLLFMLVTMYLGRLPRRVKMLTWILFAVYAIQADVIIFMRLQAPVISAFHPVLALVDFTLGYALARQAVPLASEGKTPAAAQENLEPSPLP